MPAKKADRLSGPLFSGPASVKRFEKELATYSSYPGDDPETARRLKADLLAEIQAAGPVYVGLFMQMYYGPLQVRRAADEAIRDLTAQIAARFRRYIELYRYDPNDEAFAAWQDMTRFVRTRMNRALSGR